MHRNIWASMCLITILFVALVRRLAGSARDYCWAYHALEKRDAGGDDAVDDEEAIEKTRNI